MLKQSLIYLFLSILLVIFGQYAHLLLINISRFSAYLTERLTPLFNQIQLGTTLRQVFILVLIPIIITAIPAVSYRLIKGKDMPYLIESTWCLWLVIVLSNLLMRY
ncbi:MAG: hypothetical protein H0U57_02965 [Tatlockia sp.]|nr:hypothetical protein [Tatlockia sp.]